MNLDTLVLKADIVYAIQERMRGRARIRMITQLLPQITAFVESIETKLDAIVEEQKNDH